MRVAGTAVLVLLLAACASYRPLPLAPHTRAVHGADDAPARPLSIDEVVRLAVDDNPDLRAARAQRGVAAAQLRQAGILANPAVSLSYADVQSGPGTIAALGAGFMQDLRALVTLGPARRAARDAAGEVDAGLLWQEWQLAGKARLAAVDVIQGERQLGVLRANAALAGERATRMRRAVDAGDETLAALAPDLVAAADAARQRDDFERQQATRRRDLAVLIGRSPDAPPALAERIDVPLVDRDDVEARLARLADFRPDLAALRYGYAAQEEKLRAAILTQFPAFSIGAAAARDTSNVRTLGPQLGFELPLFDRGQGRIAEETATRARLHAEFDARLAAADAELRSLLADQAQLRAQLDAKRTALDTLRKPAAEVERAYARGDVDSRTYVDTIAARNAREQDVIATETLLLEQHVAIATLTGAGLRPLSIDTAEAQP